MAGWIKMPLGMAVGILPGLCVRWGPSSQSPKGGGVPAPQFSVHDHCSQTAGWIKMALGMEVGLAPGHIVLDGEPAPLPKKGGGASPNFRLISIVAKQLHASRCHMVWR